MLPRKFIHARRASLHSDHPKHKMGAAVFHAGKLLAVGFNSLQTHPSTFHYHDKFCRHAEIHALARAKSRKHYLDAAIVVVYRETKNGGVALAKPCEMCQDKMDELGIKEVLYTTNGSYERMKL